MLAAEQIRINLAAKLRRQHGSKRDTAALTAMRKRIAPTPRQGCASPGCIRPQPALDPATGLVSIGSPKHFLGPKKPRRQISAEIGRHQQDIHMRPVGYVYILTNRSMPGLVKVGMTERHNTQSRIAELSAHTGVPEDFELAYRAQVFSAYEVEQRAHALLSKNCLKMKEFFQCDVLAAIDAVFVSAGDDLIDEESYIAQSIDDKHDDRLKRGAIRLAILQPRGRSVTGVTRLPFESQPKGIRAMMAWGLRSPAYGYLFYGSAIRNSEQLLKAAKGDFPEVDDFCAPVLLETDAGKQVRERQALQEECDRENADVLAEENRQRLEEKQRLEANRKAVEIAKAVAKWMRAVETVSLEAERLEAGRISTLKAEQKLARVARLEAKLKFFEMTRPEAKRQALEMAIAARRRATGNLGLEPEQKGGLDAEREVALEALRKAVEVARLEVERNAAEVARQKVAWTSAQEVERNAAEMAGLALDGNAAPIPELEAALKAAEIARLKAKGRDSEISRQEAERRAVEVARRENPLISKQEAAYERLADEMARLKAAENVGHKSAENTEHKAAEIVRPKSEWTDAEIEALQAELISAAIARTKAVREASEVAKVREESKAAKIAELQAAWDAARGAPHKAAQISSLKIERENQAAEWARSQAALRSAEIESAAMSSRMKVLHGISANDKCSINCCGKPPELRFDGRPYCLGHYWDMKAAADKGNTEEGRCSD